MNLLNDKRKLLKVAFLFLTVILAIFFRQQINIVKPVKAAPVAVRETSGDLWADMVLGKDDFGQAGPNQVTAFKVFNPGGVIVDKSKIPNRIFVYDGTNSRILGFRSLGYCSHDNSKPCTSDSDCKDGIHPTSSCSLSRNKPADIVLGQLDFSSSACNGDSNFQNFVRPAASAKTLCSIPEKQVSLTEGGSFANMFMDSEGNLYVGDFDNHRVLRYDTPFEKDTVADYVWGQSDFSGNECNQGKGMGNPDNQSFCFRSPVNEGFGTGVDIDKYGNLWVTDNQNNRVLRFPYNSTTKRPSKTADIVLGQPNFSSVLSGSNLNQMHAPIAIRVDQQDRVYVVDLWNHRILRFDPPFTSGANAAGLFAKDLSWPKGLEIDPKGEGIWVLDDGNHQLVLFDFNSNVKKVLFKDIYDSQGICGTFTANPSTDCLNPQVDPVTQASVCWFNICLAEGSIGFDRDNNLFVSGGSSVQDVYRFKNPIPEPVQGKLYSADWRMFYPPSGFNYPYSSKAFQSPRAIVVTSEQTIILDEWRIMFWNTTNGLEDLVNGKEADGVAGVTDFDKLAALPYGRMANQNNQYLWVTHGNKIEVYQLPLTHGLLPYKTISFKSAALPALGGGQVAFGNDEIMGIAVDLEGKVWISQGGEYTNVHRVLRIRNPLTAPVVDVILGQNDIGETACNRDANAASDYGSAYNKNAPNTICFPSAIKIDKLGNVWVSDFSLEFKGNWRLLEFDSNLFRNKTSIVLGPNASKIFPNIMALDMDFDSKNRMVVGINGYSKMYASLYNDPLGLQTEPSKDLMDLYSQAHAIEFDRFDNLYIADANRGRVLIYKQPLIDEPVPVVSITPPCPRGAFGNLDCSFNGCIDTADYELFRQAFGKKLSELTVLPNHHTPDLYPDSNNQVDTADYEIFRRNFGRCE